MLAFAHLFFPRYFNWKEELKGLMPINRQMMWVHAFFIALVLLLMGCLCILSPRELGATVLGRKLSFGFFIFWTARLLMQFIGYSRETWKGKKFETFIHVAFSILWLYFSVVFFGVFWMNTGPA